MRTITGGTRLIQEYRILLVYNMIIVSSPHKADNHVSGD